MSAPIVGIDLGTTHSLIGLLQGGRPTLLPNAVGELLTPSVVAVDDGGALLVGAAAEARAATHPETAARLFKRDMGTDRVVFVGGQGFTAPDLSAAVLRSLKADAEAALGQTIERAVITVPAYFGDLQRQATRDAGEIAGLTVERIINEPTAAALAYGLHQLDRELRAVVLDLGGGTFDVTVLEIIEGIIEIQGSAGDTRLGGEDFSEAIAGWAIDALTREQRAPAGDRLTRTRIREAAELAKRRLSTEPEARLVLPDLPLADGRRADVELTVTRAIADAAWAPLLQAMRGPIARALGDAQVAPGDLDEVLLVGGATRMPCVLRLGASIFGRMPLRALPPDETVAHGAAVQAALIAGDEAVEEMVVTDVAPFTMGVEVANRMGRRTVQGLFSPVLDRGTVIPVSRVEAFHPIHEGQRKLTLRIYQGEHPMCASNTLLGQIEVKLTRDPPPGKEGVDVRFTYDVDGILEVDVTVQATGKNHTLVIEQRPGALSREQIREARRRMAALKFHPRDALPNRTALARADALFQALTGPARDRVGEAYQRFELALAGQDTREIDAARASLLGLIGQFDRR